MCIKALLINTFAVNTHRLIVTNNVYCASLYILFILSLWLHSLRVSSSKSFIIQIHLSHLYSNHCKHTRGCAYSLPLGNYPGKALIPAASLAAIRCKQSVISFKTLAADEYTDY